MPLRIQRVLSAAFAIAVLAGLMIHAGATSGCSSSTTVAEAETPVDAASSAAVAAPPEPPAAEEETFFPASKAGPMKPRKSQAPASQQAVPNQK